MRLVTGARGRARHMDRQPAAWQSVDPASAGIPRGSGVARAMPDTANKTRTKTRLKTERLRLHKVILVNDDYTPREFVVLILKAEFRMNEDHAYRVMLTAHQRGTCVVAVYAQDIAETKATRA